MITPESAVKDYLKVLAKCEELTATYEAEMALWQGRQNKIEEYLSGLQVKLSEIPEEIKVASPYFAWQLSEKTDKDLIEAISIIKNHSIAGLESSISDKVALLKEQKENLEKYALAVLDQRKASNFNVAGIGRIEKRSDVKYNIADKALFVAWATEEKCEAELTIGLRPNSKFMAEVVKDKGELPPGVSSFKESKAVFVKAST